MFDLGIEKIAVLLVAALFVLGPERLPAAADWLGRNVRRVKAAAAAANEQVRSELGPELDQLRQPLAQLRAPLQELRALRDPRAAIMHHLLTDPDPPRSVTGGPHRAPAPAVRVPEVRPVIDSDAT